MTKIFKFDLVFLIVISLAVFLLVYLSINIIERITDIKDVIKLSGTIVLPVPLVIYASYISAPGKMITATIGRREVIIAILIFISTLIITIILINIYEIYWQSRFQDNIIIPTLINSTVTIIYAFNYMTMNNAKITGLLCGILLGMAIYIIIF